MLLALWSPKGGSGTSVFAAACALALARSSASRNGDAGAGRSPGELAVRLADLGGDQPAIFGLASDPATGLADWLAVGPEAPTDALDRLTIDVAVGVTLVPRGSDDVSVGPGAPAESGAALGVALRDGPVPTIADVGRADTPAARALLDVADVSLVVVRPCYLALRRAVRAPALARATGVVLVEEPDRVLRRDDVAGVLDIPIVARVPWRATTARLVDAGVLSRRMPESLSRAALQAMLALGVVSTRRGEAA